VFVNERDLASRGLKHGDPVDLTVMPDARARPGKRVMCNLTAVVFNIAQGSIATYYPEANVLVALDHYDAKSGTPSYKSTRSGLRQIMKCCSDWFRPPMNKVEYAVLSIVDAPAAKRRRAHEFKLGGRGSTSH
jgi:hypothetical protein